jgi:hypothetical protein
MTITEALAEIKTVTKRIQSKREFISQYLARQEQVKDPLEKDGGSAEVIQKELQAIGDLQDRIVALRRGIQSANEKTILKIEDKEASIADWLIWRREVAPGMRQFLERLSMNLRQLRDQSRREGRGFITVGSVVQSDKPTDVIVNIDEKKLSEKLETLHKILGDLDGQLSLKNATVMVEV